MIKVGAIDRAAYDKLKNLGLRKMAIQESISMAMASAQVELVALQMESNNLWDDVMRDPALQGPLDMTKYDYTLQDDPNDPTKAIVFRTVKMSPNMHGSGGMSGGRA